MSLLKEARVRLGATQTDMANRLGLSQQAVSMYENHGRVPDLKTAGKIAKEYKVSLDDLLNDMKEETEEA